MVWRNRDAWEHKYTNLQKLPDPTTYRYSENPNYTEQVEFEQHYSLPKRIIFLGTSRSARIQWDELLQRNDVFNAGIGSDITEGMLHRLSLLYPKQPTVVFLEAGINDIVLGLPAGKIIHAYRRIVDSLQQHQLQLVLQTIVPVTLSMKGSLRINEGVYLLNEYIRQLAQQKHCSFVDVASRISYQGFLRPEFAQADGIHLNAAAYQIWKEQITPLLTP